MAFNEGFPKPQPPSNEKIDQTLPSVETVKAPDQTDNFVHTANTDRLEQIVDLLNSLSARNSPGNAQDEGLTQWPNDNQGIRVLARGIRERLKGKVNIETLTSFAKSVGVEHVIDTPMVEANGGKGISGLLDEKGYFIAYHGLLPGSKRFYLAHELGHIMLGHLFNETGSIRGGLKEEWNADTFAAEMVGWPRALAFSYIHLLDFSGTYFYKLFSPYYKKREQERIVNEIGYIPENMSDLF